jgi:large-conductance mechanosensitive channel
MAKGKLNFVSWLFEQKDVDGLIIALLISDAVRNFIDNLSISIIQPILESILPTNDNSEQVLKIKTFKIKFKLQYLIAGFINLIFIFFLSYLIVKYLYGILSLN